LNVKADPGQLEGDGPASLDGASHSGHGSSLSRISGLPQRAKHELIILVLVTGAARHGTRLFNTVPAYAAIAPRPQTLAAYR
jgi:hypothetical protein